MNISDLMQRHIETCAETDHLGTAAAKMWSLDVGILPVLSVERHVIGMITDRDICMATYLQAKPPAEIPVVNAMSKAVYFTSPEATIREAEETMRTHQVRRLPVINAEGELVGIVSLNDIIREAERETGHVPKEVGSREIMDTLAAVSQPRTGPFPLL